MDPLTHTLFGAALARTRLARRTEGAVTVGIVAANIADVDAVTYLVHPDLALAWRRGWTHGPLALAVLPLAAILLPELVRRLAPRRSRGPGVAAERRWTARVTALAPLAYLAALSHPLLDWCNTYGIRLLMPFDRRWYYGDALFIVDPWIWLLLSCGLLLSASPRRGHAVHALLLSAVVAAGALVLFAPVPATARYAWLATAALALLTIALLGGRMPPIWRPRAPAAALAVVGVYAILLAADSAIAERQLMAQLGAEAAIAPLRVMVGPRPMSPLRHDVVVETEQRLLVGSFDRRRVPRLELTQELAKETSGPLIAAAREDPCVRGFLGWSRFLFARTESGADGWTIDLMDARYTTQPQAVFGSARVRLDRSGRPLRGGPGGDCD